MSHDEDLTAALDSLSEEHRAGVSVWMGELDGTAWFTYHAAVEHPAASTLKLPLIVAVHRAVERGELALDHRLLVHDEFASVVDGATYRATRGYDNDPEPWNALGEHASVGWLIERAIVMSSNLATNLLVELVGIDAVNEVYRAVGATTAILRRGIQDGPAGEYGLWNIGSAADLAAVLVAVADGRLLGRDASVAVEAVLARCRTNEAVPRGLPAGTYIAHKTGWIDAACHDVALVRPAGEPPFVLSIFSGAPLVENAIHRLVADVAELCWEHRGGLRSAGSYRPRTAVDRPATHP